MASRTEENHTGLGLAGQVNLGLGAAVIDQDHAAVVAGGLACGLHRRRLGDNVVVLAAAGSAREREQADSQQSKRAPHSSFLPEQDAREAKRHRDPEHHDRQQDRVTEGSLGAHPRHAGERAHSLGTGERQHAVDVGRVEQEQHAEEVAGDYLPFVRHEHGEQRHVEEHDEDQPHRRRDPGRRAALGHHGADERAERDEGGAEQNRAADHDPPKARQASASPPSPRPVASAATPKPTTVAMARIAT